MAKLSIVLAIIGLVLLVLSALPAHPAVSIFRTYAVGAWGGLPPPRFRLFAPARRLCRRAGAKKKHFLAGSRPPNLPLGGRPRKPYQFSAVV
jgi:hypothetical protein